MTQTHELKTWPEYFKSIVDGTKTFELRKDDRGFEVGDLLVLHEWKPVGGYTGERVTREISFVLHPAEYLAVGVIAEGYCILGLKFEPSKLPEVIKCHMLAVDFDPTGADGHRTYGTEVTLKTGEHGKQWRSGNYLVIPVDVMYELSR